MDPLPRRRLGRTDIVARVLGFGGSEIGYERVSVRAVARLLGGPLDAGLNAIDTAECYGDGERLIGAAVGARRREFSLFTKCGHAAGWGRPDWRPAALLASIERSLSRLATGPPHPGPLHSGLLGRRPGGGARGAGRGERARAAMAGRRPSRSRAAVSTRSSPG